LDTLKYLLCQMSRLLCDTVINLMKVGEIIFLFSIYVLDIRI